MTVWKPKDCRTWRYSFYFRKQRHTGSTGFSTKRQAERFEQKTRARLELEASGMATPGPESTPRFGAWAGVYYEHAARQVTRPERIDDLLRVLLRFFGPRPAKGARDGEPYHDLRLGDAIAAPRWIADFEDWMDAKCWSGQTKNQYRSTLRQMYRLALQPRWRTKTGIQTNPMEGIYRDRPGERDVTITPTQLRAILSHASYHVRLAVAIGALAPKLRLANILGLQWGVNLDRDLRFITVRQHKTAATIRRPLVIPVSAQLRTILEDAKRRTRGPHVVSYRGRPVASIRGGVAAAVKAAGLPYGRALDEGVTFHTLRHSAATLLAELDVSEAKRKSVMGHEHIATTQKYTHLRPVHEVPIVEQLSTALPIDDLVMARRRRAVRKPVQLSGGTVANEPVTTRTSAAPPASTRHAGTSRSRAG